MKDAYEVLYRKEADLVRVRQEIESLTLVASLLNDVDQSSEEDAISAEPGLIADESKKKPPSFEGQAFLPLPESPATGTDGQPSEIVRRPKKTFWNVLTSRG
jgi:hypothetical protein